MSLILIKAIHYLPDQILQKHLIEKFGDKNNPSYLDLNIRSLIFSLWEKKSIHNNPYLIKLQEYEVSRGFKISIILSFILTVFCSIPYFFFSVLLVIQKAIFLKKNVLRILLEIRLLDILSGDCICNDSLRSSKSTGLLKLDTNLLYSWYKIVANLLFFKSFFYFSGIKSKQTFFYIPETGYVNELIRRLLISYNSNELRLNWETGKIAKIGKPLIGPQIAMLDFGVRNYKEYNNKESIQTLQSLVNRETSYPMMAGFDVDSKIVLNNDYVKGKCAIIFLHCVSDLQYWFGVDCFLDLHDWLMQSCKLLKKHNFEIIIKFHPAFFNENFIYESDQNYLNYLSKFYEVDIKNISKNALTKTKIDNIYLVNHQVSTLELHNKFNNFLCITHHGTVTIEAAFLGHEVIASAASPYFQDCSFVKTYNNIEEYESFVKEFNPVLMALSDKQKEDLYKYVFSMNRRINHDQLMLELMLIFDISLSNDNPGWHQEFLFKLSNIKPGSTYEKEVDNYFYKMF